MTFAPTDADYAKINPALAEDTQWQQTRGKLEGLLSPEGLRKPSNPFTEYLDKIEENLRKAAAREYAKSKEYDFIEGTYRKADGSKLSEAEEAEIYKQSKPRATELLETHKKEILLNAARGYSKQDPMPAGDLIVKGGLDGAMGSLLSGSFDVVGGAKQGIMDSLRQFIMDIPYVGKFISQLNNWVGSHVGAMFGSGQEAISWEDAGKLADAQKASDKIGNGLSVYSGLNLEAVKSQISHSLTYEDGQQTAAPSPSTPAPTASANPTPAPAAETPPPPPLPTTTTPTQAAPPAEAAPPPAQPALSTPAPTAPAAPANPEERTENIGEDGQCSTRIPSADVKLANLGNKFRNGEYDRIPVNGAGAGGVGAVGAPLTARDISVV